MNLTRYFSACKCSGTAKNHFLLLTASEGFAYLMNYSFRHLPIIQNNYLLYIVAVSGTCNCCHQRKSTWCPWTAYDSVQLRSQACKNRKYDIRLGCHDVTA